MGAARLILMGAMLTAGIALMVDGQGPVAPAPQRPAPALSTTSCAGAAWPYRSASCRGDAATPAVRVIGVAVPLRVAER
ncbi:hypothetical protein [Methylobacterium sp. JK268]